MLVDSGVCWSMSRCCIVFALKRRKCIMAVLGFTIANLALKFCAIVHPEVPSQKPRPTRAHPSPYKALRSLDTKHFHTPTLPCHRLLTFALPTRSTLHLCNRYSSFRSLWNILPSPIYPVHGLLFYWARLLLCIALVRTDEQTVLRAKQHSLKPSTTPTKRLAYEGCVSLLIRKCLARLTKGMVAVSSPVGSACHEQLTGRAPGTLHCKSLSLTMRRRGI